MISAGDFRNGITIEFEGNVYQISMVVTAKELECRFGNNTEITAFLSVLSDKPDDDGNYAVMYQFEEIMIFKRKD